MRSINFLSGLPTQNLSPSKVDTIPNTASTLHNLPGLSASSSQCSMLTIFLPMHNVHVQLGAMVSMNELVEQL